MNIYLVERTDDWSYDNYDSFICIADDEQEAKEMHPSRNNNNWDEMYREWIPFNQRNFLLKVTLIGVALSSEKKCVVLASYNAG